MLIVCVCEWNFVCGCVSMSISLFFCVLLNGRTAKCFIFFVPPTAAVFTTPFRRTTFTSWHKFYFCNGSLKNAYRDTLKRKKLFRNYNILLRYLLILYTVTTTLFRRCLKIKGACTRTTTWMRALTAVEVGRKTRTSNRTVIESIGEGDFKCV